MELGGRLHHDGRFPEGQYPIRSLGSMVYVDDFIESRKKSHRRRRRRRDACPAKARCQNKYSFDSNLLDVAPFVDTCPEGTPERAARSQVDTSSCVAPPPSPC